MARTVALREPQRQHSRSLLREVDLRLIDRVVDVHQRSGDQPEMMVGH